MFCHIWKILSYLEDMKEIDTLRTPECLDTVSIGLFAEGKLGDEEKQRAEEHLLTCLYCLKQLVDMKEMLYYEKHPTPISPELVQRLKPCVTTGAALTPVSWAWPRLTPRETSMSVGSGTG